MLSIQPRASLGPRLPTVHRVALGKEEWLLCQKYQATVARPDEHFTGRGKMLKEELWPGRGKEDNKWQLCGHYPLTNARFLDLLSISPVTASVHPPSP